MSAAIRTAGACGSNGNQTVRGTNLTRASLSLIMLVTTAVSGRTADNPPFARVLPERVSGDARQENWNALQFLQADAKGRVFLLHGDNLAVDQLLPSGKVVVWRAPRHNDEAAATGMVSDAVMSPDGSSWVLLTPSESDHLTLLDGDDLRDLPATQWWVSALAYTGDGPVIAVLPATVGGGDAGASLYEAARDKPPFLLLLHDQAWQTLAEQETLQKTIEGNRDLRPKVTISPQKIKAERETRLAAGRKGTLWVAQQNAYVLRRYSGSGALEESVAGGGGP